MPPWLKIGTVVLTLGIAMPLWAAAVIVELAHGEFPDAETMAIPIGLLAAAGLSAKGGWTVDIRRKKDPEGDKPDASD